VLSSNMGDKMTPACTHWQANANGGKRK